MTYKIYDVERLLTVCRRILDLADYDDGNAISSTLDFELLERSVHRMDPSFKVSRADSDVDPCPFDCAHCKTVDTPSSGNKMEKLHAPVRGQEE